MRDKYPDPGRGSSHFTTISTVANSNVSKKKSLISPILYAAPVTRNMFAEMLIMLALLFGGEKFNAVWSCSAQSCSYRTVTLFVQSGRIQASTQGEVEQIKICICAEMFCSELFG